MSSLHQNNSVSGQPQPGRNMEYLPKQFSDAHFLEVENRIIEIIIARLDKTSIPVAIRGLSRKEAARYVGISCSKFDLLVTDGRMPRPVRIDSRTVWDKRDIDEHFELLKDSGGDDSNGWLSSEPRKEDWS